VHETDHGGSFYRFATGAATPGKDEEDKPGKAKDAKAIKESKDAKKGDTDKIQDGDKGLSDQTAGGDIEKKDVKGEGSGSRSGTATPSSGDHTHVQENESDHSKDVERERPTPPTQPVATTTTQQVIPATGPAASTPTGYVVGQGQQGQGQAPQYTQNEQPPRVDLRHDTTGPLDLHLGREIHKV
jgi:hypothetical protein